MSRVLAIVGPTATGKSDLAVEVARQVDAEVVNADSMQLYRGMDIGTAKLSTEQQRGVPHHLLDVLEVTETATVAAYQRVARATVDDLIARDRTAILVGGSGLYLAGSAGRSGLSEHRLRRTGGVGGRARCAMARSHCIRDWLAWIRRRLPRSIGTMAARSSELSRSLR
ncbi:MAG: isopentenyl transferase family protein [Geodermatophilaceae bacterium]